MKQQVFAKPSSLSKRLLTGVVTVLLIVSLVFSGELGFLVLLLLVSQVALSEYARLIRLSGVHPQQSVMHGVSAVSLLLTWNWHSKFLPVLSPLLLVLLPVLVLVVELFRNQPNPFHQAAVSLLGIVWIGLPFCLILYLGFWPFTPPVYNPFLVLDYFLILWMGDSGAYVVGKYFGRHKLFERISPKKTWEGSAGGLLMAAVAGVLSYYSMQQLQLQQWLVLAIIINVSGTFGDFTKSLLKRSVGVKDAGNILPGHGGMLDRFDSLIGSAPFAFLYLLWLEG